MDVFLNLLREGRLVVDCVSFAISFVRYRSLQFPRIRWDCVHVWFLFTVCERVICVNGDVIIAPVVVAIVERLES
jgi:hypothetical protein